MKGSLADIDLTAAVRQVSVVILCRPGNGITRSGIALFARQLAKLPIAHFQQAVGVDKVMIIMTDSENSFTHLLHQRQQHLIKLTTEVWILDPPPIHPAG